MKFKYLWILISFICLNQVQSQVTCLSELNLPLSGTGVASITTDMLALNDPTDFDVMFLSKYDFDCNDLGSNDVTVYGVTGTDTTTCISNVIVYDAVGPIVLVEPSITVSLNGNNTPKITPEMLDDGTYDHCTAVSLSVSPSVLDCKSTSPVLVFLIAEDSFGNVSEGVSYVHIDSTLTTFQCAGIDVITVANGSYEMTLEKVFSDGIPCYGDYSFTISSTDGPIPADNIFNSTHVGYTYTITVTESTSGNTCNFTFEVVDGDIPYNICVVNGVGEGVADVKLGDSNIYTDATGCALYPAVPGEILTFSKSGPNLDGVDVADYVLLAQAVLGQTTLNKAAQIAADVNDSEWFSTLDQYWLDLTIGGIDTIALPWLFYDLSNGIPALDKYLTTPQTLELDHDYSKTVVAIKRGDLNFSQADLVSDDNTDALVVKDLALINGEKYTIPIKINTSGSFTGIQFSVPFETEDYLFVNLSSNLPGSKFKYFPTTDKGAVQFFWAAKELKDAVTMKKGDVIVEVEVLGKSNSVLHETFEVITTNANKLVSVDSKKGNYLKMEYEGIISVPTIEVKNSVDVRLYPNPVSDKLIIDTKGIDIARVEVYGVDGRLLFAQKRVLTNSIDFAVYKPGLYLVHIQLPNGEVVKRLIQKQ